MKETVKAFAYLRVSGKGQVEGDGFPRQRVAIEKYAKAHGIALLGEYRDEGVSGTKELADRNGLAALLDRLESNGVRMVLVEKADRLARDFVVGEIILKQFRNLGVTVVEAEGGTDLATGGESPTRVLIRRILGVVPDFEKSVIVLKLKAARDRMRLRDGRCEGRKPFGSRPSEAKALARLLELRRKPRGGERRSVAAIAGALNAEGHSTRGGKPWKPGSVYAILKRVKDGRDN
jgi:DNA invertase Pin-like site-specific DNA recombinase